MQVRAFNDLLTRRYEVPLVYFPLHNDFEQVADALARKVIHNPYTEEHRFIAVGEDFIDVRALSPDIFDEVCSYLPLVRALIDGELSARDIVFESAHNTLLQNAVVSSLLQETNAEPLIYH